MVYQGYLELVGIGELVNAPRTQSYVRQHLPQVTLRGCHTCDYFRFALATGGVGDVPFPGTVYPGSTYPNGTLTDAESSYTNPATDFAPWYQASRPASADFYGFYPIDVQGMDDSTHQTTVTELVGDGGIVPRGRHHSREVRVKTLAIAATQEALEEGMAWLRSTLDSTDTCGDSEGVATGQQLRFFTYCPGHEDISKVPSRSQDAVRLMYRVQTLEAPILTPQTSTSGVMALVEYTLVAGVPWWFTYARDVGSLTGSTSNQVPHVPLPPDLDSYDELIDDPTYGTVSRPPRPPLIIPNSVRPPSNWYHYTFQMTPEFTERWGRGMVRLRVTSGTAARRMIRVRFYSNPDGRPESQLRGRGWDGEFLISYLPANSELVLDSALGTARLAMLTDGRTSPAGHLVHGSDGRPFEWPSLSCDTPYVVQVDSQTQLGNGRIAFEMATRE